MVERREGREGGEREKEGEEWRGGGGGEGRVKGGSGGYNRVSSGSRAGHNDRKRGK